MYLSQAEQPLGFRSQNLEPFPFDSLLVFLLYTKAGQSHIVFLILVDVSSPQLISSSQEVCTILSLSLLPLETGPDFKVFNVH